MDEDADEIEPQPLFPGASCSPLSPTSPLSVSDDDASLGSPDRDETEKILSREHNDQLNKIFDIIGTP